jgi:hypothetical protein
VGKVGVNRRGTIRNYRKRNNHLAYKRFEGFRLPIQQPGHPSGVCLGSTKLSEENCRCGKHNLAWLAREAKRKERWAREALEEAEGGLEGLLVPEAELALV